MTTAVLLVDNNKVFRMGLNLLVSNEQDMRVVGQAGDGQTALEQARQLQPDVVAMNISLPNMDGIEATRQIISAVPQTKIIALSIHDEKDYVEKMLQTGAVGYVLKGYALEDLVTSIRTVQRGEIFLSAAIRDVIVAQYIGTLTGGSVPVEIADGSPILSTKLHKPPITSDLVLREQLIKRLERLWQRPLTLISAPAGYGKTTLVSSWLATVDTSAAWYQLDENDNELAVFLGYIVAAVRTLFPDLCPKTNSLIKAPDLPPLSVLTATLISELEIAATPFILVLDDYHLIHEPSIHQFLNELLRHPLSTMHLVIATRQDPPLPLPKLRAKGLVLEIRQQDLRFKPADTAVFLRNITQTVIDDATAAQVTEKTEGWVTGLRLAALSLRHQGDMVRRLADLPKNIHYVTDYLVSEVLANQPLPVQEYLLKTSILSRLCAPLGDDVFGTLDQNILTQIAQQNLFVIPLDSQHHWFRYHHLFQELLHQRLRQKFEPEDVAELHRRASTWFAQNGYLEEAVKHALAAGDKADAMKLIDRQRHMLMNTEKWSRLRRLLEMIPLEDLEKNPSFLLTKAFILDYRAEMTEVFSLLEQVEPLVESLSPEFSDYKSVHGEYNALLAERHLLSAKGELALACAAKALQLLPNEAQLVRHLAMNWYVFALQMTGDLAQSIKSINEAIYSPKTPDYNPNFRYYRQLSALYFIDGNLEKTKQSALRVWAFGEKQDLPETLGMASYYLAALHYVRNELVEAIKYIELSHEKRYEVRAAYYAQTAFIRALIYTAQGQPEEACAVVEAVIAFAAETKNSYVMDAARAFKVELALRQDKVLKAEQLMQGVTYDLVPPVWFFYHAQLTLAKVQLAVGGDINNQRAREQLDQFNVFGERTHNNSFRIQVLALQALLHAAQGEEPAALEKLRESLALAEPGGFIRSFVDLGPNMAALLVQLHNEGEFSGYIDQILDAFAENVPAAEARFDQTETSAAQKPAPSLTKREIEVLRLLATKSSTAEIAEELFVSEATVRTHTKRIYSKLDVHSRVEAALAAQEMGLH